MASCRLQNYTKWLKEELGIILTLWHSLFKADHVYYLIGQIALDFVKKKLFFYDLILTVRM